LCLSFLLMHLLLQLLCCPASCSTTAFPQVAAQLPSRKLQHRCFPASVFDSLSGSCRRHHPACRTHG
jgi:hypothetical protein